MLSPRFIVPSITLFSLCFTALACTEFNAFCTKDEHCLPHEVCTEQSCVSFDYPSPSDLAKNPPFKDMELIKEDMGGEMVTDMKADMSMDMDMSPDFTIDEDPFTPPVPTCNVTFPNGESPVLVTNNLGIKPKLLCTKDVLLMIAPVNDSIPVMEKCVGIDFETDPEAEMEMSGGEQSDEDSGGQEPQTPSDPNSTNQVAIYQYGRATASGPLTWHMRYSGEYFDPNTEFHLIDAEVDDALHTCNRALLYINRSPQAAETGQVSKVSLMIDEFDTQTEWIEGRRQPIFNLSYKTQDKYFIQRERLEDQVVINQIVELVPNRNSIKHADCTSSFESIPNVSQALKTWNPTLTKAGFAWMQTHPTSPRLGELHLVSRNSIKRLGSDECDQVIIDLYNLSTQDPDQLWRMPLQYDHEQHLYYCRYLNGGTCQLHAKDVNEQSNAYKEVKLKESNNTRVLHLPTSSFSVLGNYLVYIYRDEDRPIFNLALATLDPSAAHQPTFNFTRPLDYSLRFPDLQLYREKEAGARLNAYWISGQAQGWQVKISSIDTGSQE